MSCVISLDFSRQCSHIAQAKRFGAQLIGFDLPQGRVSVRGQGMPLLCFAYICNFQYCIKKWCFLRPIQWISTSVSVHFCYWTMDVFDKVELFIVHLFFVHNKYAQNSIVVKRDTGNLWLPLVYAMQCIANCNMSVSFSIRCWCYSFFLLLHSIVSRSKLHLCHRIHFDHHDTI